jgi:hypothetical protein
VIAVEGFNPQRIRSLKEGIETTLGGKILAAAILDRDLCCEGECKAAIVECEQTCDVAVIHHRKGIENFLLVTPAINRAAERAVAERNKRSGSSIEFEANAAQVLGKLCTGDHASSISNE